MQEQDLPRSGSASCSTSARWRRLGACLLVIGVIWLVVLPWIGSRPDFSAQVRDQAARGIDPGALYYTDLPAAAGIAHRVERLQQSHGDAFWSWSREPRSVPSEPTSAANEH